jgi:DNA-directed RNA polymerase alpha subunit
MYCEKEIGKTHTKWSPVSTVSYRALENTSGKPSNHFIFSIETSGVLPPEVLIREAMSLLIESLERDEES